MVVSRFDVCLVNLDPTVGSEIKKVRPCLVISPDEMNHNIRTVIVAPMTTAGKNYPTRVQCMFKRKRDRLFLIRYALLTKPESLKSSALLI